MRALKFYTWKIILYSMKAMISLYFISKKFAPQISLASVVSYLGLNVISNCHGLSRITFGLRAFEVLYLENASEFDESNDKLAFHNQKVLPLKFLW